MLAARADIVFVVPVVVVDVAIVEVHVPSVVIRVRGVYGNFYDNPRFLALILFYKDGGLYLPNPHHSSSRLEYSGEYISSSPQLVLTNPQPFPTGIGKPFALPTDDTHWLFLCV